MTTTPEAGMRLVPEKWLEVARYATESGLNAHEANVRRIEFDRIVSPLALLSLAAAPVPPAGGEGETIEERFPALNDHLIRMASTGTVGSLTEWGDFFTCLREALAAGGEK